MNRARICRMIWIFSAVSIAFARAKTGPVKVFSIRAQELTVMRVLMFPRSSCSLPNTQ